MSNYHYTDIWNKNFSDKYIDAVFSTARHELTKEIDIIVLKHSILLHYYEFKNIPLFGFYYDDKVKDIILDYHIEVYKIATELALEVLLMMSTNLKEEYNLRRFQYSLYQKETENMKWFLMQGNKIIKDDR